MSYAEIAENADKYILQLIMAYLGALGFSLLFNSGKKFALYAAAGGLAGWAVYLFCSALGVNIFLSSVITSSFCACFAEIIARRLKAPATVFIIPAIVPLIPGGTLYYTVNYAVYGSAELFREYGFKTICYAFGIASGISIVSAVMIILKKKKQD